jgi:hypothetical protein
MIIWFPCFLYNMLYSLSQYLFCKKSNRRLEFNDIVFFHLSTKRRWGMATGEVEVMHFLLYIQCILNLPYIFSIFFYPIKILFSYITSNFCHFCVIWANFSITIQPILTIFHPCIDHGGYMSARQVSPDLDLTGPSWSWSYGSWIYNCLCNQCLSSQKLWVRTPFMAICTRYNIMW